MILARNVPAGDRKKYIIYKVRLCYNMEHRNLSWTNFIVGKKSSIQ
jgi:hypothetical protein